MVRTIEIYTIKVRVAYRIIITTGEGDQGVEEIIEVKTDIQKNNIKYTLEQKQRR